ncbi:efflux RND transporter periplasmic adaptor subunit [Ferrimonas aestuarii]|uniref:Efflux RND transporter periplasmic adaptor subunit n=1 Tax=Ferrimonas aestuarii TaxID=2569539 RepID=A0A4U1BRG8_9GAMM|nr:efflux RND transporter periplasmic adaptor subunit [Ferrimonas aestuarii]TKB54310.1 efflux RND transporter periplasmic adaptor subunit [Ferrimonas aestuarii]
MKKLLLPLIVAGALSTWYLLPTDAAQAQYQYTTVALSQGDIKKQVSATGALAAVDDVVVGAQLSGQITELLVDFNDKVEQGQLLARIDPRSFAATVDQYQAQKLSTLANIEQQQVAIKMAQVNAKQAKRELVRGQDLVKTNNISQEELELLETAYELKQLEITQAQNELARQQASLASTDAQLLQAQINLDRTEIRAPISGIVINRTIEAGQTVASSYNTPELFEIAKDLSQMEIEAYIDESDIGLIDKGQRVQFAVDAYPEQRFHGQVHQIRKSPTSESGVVTYTVVIKAGNPDEKLLPGMTADLSILIDTAHNVLRVPNSAIRIGARFASQSQPQSKMGGKMAQQIQQLDLTDEQQAQLREAREALKSDGFGRNREAIKQKMEQAFAQVLTEQQKQKLQQLKAGDIRLGQVMVQENGDTRMVNVQLGLSDDQYTEIKAEQLLGANIVTQVQEISL